MVCLKEGTHLDAPKTQKTLKLGFRSQELYFRINVGGVWGSLPVVGLG